MHLLQESVSPTECVSALLYWISITDCFDTEIFKQQEQTTKMKSVTKFKPTDKEVEVIRQANALDLVYDCTSLPYHHDYIATLLNALPPLLCCS